MAASLHWEYRMDGRDLALYDGEKQLGRVSVKRDAQGRITAGYVFTHKPREINFIDFFDKAKKVSGLVADDASRLLAIKEGFFRIEGYVPGADTSATYMYAENAAEREKTANNFEALRRETGKRHEDFLNDALSDIFDDLDDGE